MCTNLAISLMRAPHWIIYIYIYTYNIYIYIQYHGISRICADVNMRRSSTLAARIEKLLFVFCGPKAGARFWSQKWGNSSKISSPASKLVAPILGPWCALPCTKTGCIFHSCVLALGAKMLLSHAGYAVKAGKKHAGPQPQEWAHIAAQAKGSISKGAGMPVLFRSKHARWNFDCHKQCEEMCTASGNVQDPGPNRRTRDQS